MSNRNYAHPAIVGLIFLFGFLSGMSQVLPMEVSKELSDRLARQDSIIFHHILSTCDIRAASALLADDFVFLQSEGTDVYSTQIPREQFLSNSKSFCERINKSPAKMVRTVVAGTLKAHYMNNTTVIQTGKQHFFAVDAGASPVLREISKFINIWIKENDLWKLSKQFIDQQPIASVQLNTPVYAIITRMDSLLFSALNNRNLDLLGSLYSKKLEFYHDKGGVMNYNQVMEINRQNFQQQHARVRRELDKSSLQVYAAGPDHVIQIGRHHFFTTAAGSEQLTASPYFVHIWERDSGRWTVIRAISYGH